MQVDLRSLCRNAGFFPCDDEDVYRQQELYIQEICDRLEVPAEEEESFGLFQRPLPPEGIEIFYFSGNHPDNLLYFCFLNRQRIEMEARKMEGTEMTMSVKYDETGKVPLFGSRPKVTKKGNINLAKVSPNKQGQDALDILLAYTRK